MKYLILLFIGFLSCVSFTASAQERIELISANELEGSVINGKNVRILRGNVALKQGYTFMYCDLAHQYYEQNELEAFDHVRIVQGDSLSVSGDKLFYNGATKLAQIRGKEVVLKDKKATLYTTAVDYDMANKTMTYFNGGRVVDGENTLTSDKGYYYPNTKLFTFKNNVVLRSKEYTMYCDTLLYNSGLRIAYFKGPTKIVGKDGTLSAEDGEYNTITKKMIFKSRSRMEYKEYSVAAQILDYNQLQGTGTARKSVVINSLKDSTIVTGELAYYDRSKGYSKVYANALMKNKFGTDTLYLKADTLITINDTLTGNRKVFAYHNVKVFHRQLQASCDSLVYNLSDSLLYFYNKPILWSSGSQILADSIWIRMRKGKINRMYLRKNAFLITKDSLGNYNQVKGKNMLAHFDDSTRIEKIDVKGNGESIYFALEGDTSLVGMNKVQCSDMQVRFEKKKVKTIVFYKKPDAVFTPPHEIQDPERRLKGFRWHSDLTPNLAMVNSKIDYSGVEIPLVLPRNMYQSIPEEKITRKQKRELKKQEREKKKAN